MFDFKFKSQFLLFSASQFLLFIADNQETSLLVNRTSEILPTGS